MAIKLTPEEFEILLRLNRSRTGSLLFQGVDAAIASRLCFYGPVPPCGGYDMGNDSFLAQITPCGVLTINELMMEGAA